MPLQSTSTGGGRYTSENSARLPPTKQTWSSTSTTTSIRPQEFQVSNVAAFEAASHDIARIIEKEGSISSARCAQIMQQKNYIVELVKEHFPHSYGTDEVVEKIMGVLRSRGCTPDKTVFAHSTCPDKIIQGRRRGGSITEAFADRMDEVSKLGGLAGIPFAGKAGFKAFVQRAPYNGHCFVLLAPHIGMDDLGTLGKCQQAADQRDEEEDDDGDSACCAGAIASYNHCCAHPSYPILPSVPGNPEFTYLLHQMGQRYKLIMARKERNAIQAEIVRHCHEIAKGMLDTIVHTDFGNEQSTLVILTGIQINMPAPFQDFFQPLSFYSLDKIGRKKDLFVQTFCHWSPLQEKMKEKNALMFFCT